MPEGEVTLGELSRSLAAAVLRIDGQFTEVNRRLDNLEFIPRREFDVVVAALTEDVRELKESRLWTQRALIASLLLPVIAAIVIALVVTRQ